MKYQIHIRSAFAPHAVGSLIKSLDVLHYLRGKNVKAELFSNKPVIKCELDNPGLITHIKKQFGDDIIGIFSDRHGAGQYKRPDHGLTPRLFGPSAQPLTPPQVAKAYNFPKPGPTIKERVVAILELGGGYDTTKVYEYCKQLGVASPRLYGHNVETGSNTPGGGGGSDGEVCLDVDVVAAVAPGIKILVIFAPNTTNGFIDAVYGCSDYFLRLDSLAISWGMPEGNWDPAAIEAMNNAIKACVNKGINVFVAAGDDGSSDGGEGNNVDFPASSPYSIACGGTKLILNKDGSRHSEVVWNEMLLGEGATGGGVSTANANRSVPDIAGNADPNSGYIVSVNGEEQAIGGTSAVAPLMAALNALVNSNLDKPAANLRDTFYANTGIFFDVTSGNNGAFKAKVGYDCCTGLGVPDGTKLLNVLKPSMLNRLVGFLKKPIRDFL